MNPLLIGRLKKLMQPMKLYYLDVILTGLVAQQSTLHQPAKEWFERQPRIIQLPNAPQEGWATLAELLAVVREARKS